MRAVILAALLAATATGARAAEDVAEAQRADMRCFLSMSVMAKNETYKEWAQFGVFFYTGRMKGRDSTVDLAAELRREYPRMPAAAYNDEIKRCNAELGDVSRGLEALRRAAPRGVGR